MIVRLHSSGPVEIITTNEGAQIAYGNEGQMYSIEPQKNVWVCTCGMSKAYPLCDGSHNNDKVMVLPKSNDDGLLSDGEMFFSNKEPISKELIDEFNEYLKKKTVKEVETDIQNRIIWGY